MNKIFETAQKLLSEGVKGEDIFSLQVSLKLLGFMPCNYKRQCDGIIGGNTRMAINALQHFCKLPIKKGIPYPQINGLLLNKEFTKVPLVENPQEENKRIMDYLNCHKQDIINKYQVPYDFIKAILWQETGLMHYDPDGFVFIGCDFGIKKKWEYRSRGWGIGQYTIKNHPISQDQLKDFVLNPLGGLEKCIEVLKEKSNLYAVKKYPLCIYDSKSVNYLSSCRECVASSERISITLPNATYHPVAAQRGYTNVPLFCKCVWALATERYNGKGANAVAYKYEVLSKIEGKEIR